MDYVSQYVKPINNRSGNKELVIYYHGCEASPGFILPYVDDMLARGYDVVSPLFPGHGTKLEDMLQYGSDEWLECARETIEKELDKYDKIHVCGHSLGGAISAYIAGLYASTNKIGKVLLMCPGFGIAGADFYKMNYRKLGKTTFPFTKSPNLPAHLEPYAYTYSAMFLKTVKDLIYNGGVCLEMLPRVTSPVTLLYTKADIICDVPLIEKSIKLIENLDFVYAFEKSSHNITCDCEWELCEKLIKDWIKK